MTVEALAAALAADSELDPAVRAAAADLAAAGVPCRVFGEIENELPPKPRYLGAGPWLDAVREIAGTADDSRLQYPYPEDAP
jgi:hypothetical protein